MAIISIPAIVRDRAVVEVMLTASTRAARITLFGPFPTSRVESGGAIPNEMTGLA